MEICREMICLQKWFMIDDDAQFIIRMKGHQELHFNTFWFSAELSFISFIFPLKEGRQQFGACEVHLPAVTAPTPILPISLTLAQPTQHDIKKVGKFVYSLVYLCKVQRIIFDPTFVFCGRMFGHLEKRIVLNLGEHIIFIWEYLFIS